MGTVRQISERKLHLKDIATLVAILGVLGGIYIWGNTAVIIPTVLDATRVQTIEMIKEHERRTHDTSFSLREFRLWSEQVVRRLEKIEEAMRR